MLKNTRFKLLLFGTWFLLSTMVFAENETQIIPILSYDYVSLETQQYHIPGAGVVFKHGDQEQKNLTLAAFYKSYILMQERNYGSLHHGIDLLAEYTFNRHLILGVFEGLSSDPLYRSGLHTFATGLGYGYELLQNENLSLTLGLGIGVSDFGEINGIRMNVIPIPIIRFSMDYPMVNVFFQFLTEPYLNITIAPESRFRFTGDFGLIGFDNISENLIYECTLWYRFFDNTHRLGDFAGLGFGIKNNHLGLTKVNDRDKSYDINSHALFGILDLSFLQISGGYIYSAYEMFDLNRKENAGRGFFISAMAAWQF